MMKPLYFYKGHLYHIVIENAKFKSVESRKWYNAIGYARADDGAENKNEIFFRAKEEFEELFIPVEVQGTIR